MGAAQEPVLASQAVVDKEVLPSDAASILYLRGWRLAQESDFDSNELGWLRAQGATPGGTVHGDFSGKNNGRDAAYILIGDQGIMRVVLLSQGKLVYDQRYQQILAAIRVPASNLNAIEWRDPLPGNFIPSTMLDPVAVKAMERPSRDHAKLLTAVSDLLNWNASPPSGRMTKTWFLSPARLLRNASQLPSGDHCGLELDFSERVS